MINNHRDQTLYFSEHKYFQQTQVVYQGDIFLGVFVCFLS